MVKFTIATLAPIVNSITVFPQVYKTYTTKSVKDLSLLSLLLFVTSNLLWLAHGYFISDNSLMIAGVTTLTANLTLVILYFIYSKDEKII